MIDEDKVLYRKVFKTLSFADAQKDIEYNVDPEKVWNTQVTYTWSIENMLKVQIMCQRYGTQVSYVAGYVMADGAKVQITDYCLREVMPAELYDTLRAYILSLSFPKTDEEKVRAALNFYVLGNGL